MAIAAVALVAVLGSMAAMVLSSYQAAAQLEQLEQAGPPPYIKVASAVLEDNNVTLLVNVTNYGQVPLFNLQDTYVIVMYNSSSGEQVQVFNLTAYPPVAEYVGGGRIAYQMGTALMPGATVELELNLSYQALRTSPITITVVPLKAPEAQYSFIPGP